MRASMHVRMKICFHLHDSLVTDFKPGVEAKDCLWNKTGETWENASNEAFEIWRCIWETKQVKQRGNASSNACATYPDWKKRTSAQVKETACEQYSLHLMQTSSLNLERGCDKCTLVNAIEWSMQHMKTDIMSFDKTFLIFLEGWGWGVVVLLSPFQQFLFLFPLCDGYWYNMHPTQ